MPRPARSVSSGRNVLALKGAARRAWQSQCAMIFQHSTSFRDGCCLERPARHPEPPLDASGPCSTSWPRADILRALEILDRLGIAEQARNGPRRCPAASSSASPLHGRSLQDPKIILADEPIASLDPMNAQVVMDTLKRINVEDGRMVIANLHTLDTAPALLRPVIGMRDGRIVFDGDPSHFRPRPPVTSMAPTRSFNEAATSTSIPTDTTADRTYADLMLS